MDKASKRTKQGETSLALIPEEVISRRRERIAARRGADALIAKLAVITVICAFVLTFVFGVSTVKGEGMYPRIRDGDLVIYYRLEDSWHIGDVIAFMEDKEMQYGRIVAMGGDTVDLTEDGQLMVNGSVQQEEIFFDTNKDGREAELPIILQQDEVFVLGDCRTIAVDSRDYGPIAESEIDGKVISVLRRRGL